jgi:hypothetical protein
LRLFRVRGYVPYCDRKTATAREYGRESKHSEETRMVGHSGGAAGTVGGAGQWTEALGSGDRRS